MDLEKDIKELRSMVMAQEEVVAQLTMAYAEVWMIVEALTQLNAAGHSEEEMDAFWKNLAEVRAEMYKEMSKAGGNSDMESGNSNFAKAVEHLVTGESTSPTD